MLHQRHLLYDSICSDASGNLLQRSLLRNGSDTQVTTHQDRQAFLALTEASLNIFLMTLERIVFYLSVTIVDRRGHQDIIQSIAIIGHCTVESFYGCLSRLWCRHTHIYLHLFLYGSEEIDPSILCILCFLDDRELSWQIHRLTIVSCHLRGTIYNRCTEFQHFWLCKCLKDEFISDTIGIAMGDCHPYVLIVHCLFFNKVLFANHLNVRASFIDKKNDPLC